MDQLTLITLNFKNTAELFRIWAFVYMYMLVKYSSYFHVHLNIYNIPRRLQRLLQILSYYYTYYNKCLQYQLIVMKSFILQSLFKTYSWTVNAYKSLKEVKVWYRVECHWYVLQSCNTLQRSNGRAYPCVTISRLIIFICRIKHVSFRPSGFLLLA